MAEGTPFIPETITVHLGRPNNTSARNVTVSFPDYIKNVASSELYPTWNENALRANIYAIISYTLNRVYTEWYRSQGYNFDITNSIQYDHSFVENRDIFEPISRIVEEIFNDYIVRQGQIEPLYATYCDGIEVTCEGLTQWGSVDLANQGFVPYDILTYFYGDNINIVENAPVRTNIPSYPGEPLTIGSGGTDVNRIELQLNRIAANYPAIPKIYPVDVTYDIKTADAVREFQNIFNLPQTGVVDKATWYKINYIYTSVKRLSQLNSEGLTLGDLPTEFPLPIDIGATGLPTDYIQYYLEVIGAYYKDVLPVEQTGTYDEQTADSVRSFQQVYGLPETGTVDERTWNDLYRAYLGIVENVPINIEGENAVLFPGTVLTEGITSEYVRVLQEYLSYISQSYPSIPTVTATGYFGPVTRNAVSAFQRQFGYPVTGSVGAGVWDAISDVYYDLRYGYTKQPGQYPGYVIE